MATWPTTLPAPQLSGYQVAPVDPSIRTDMEFGAPRVRRRTLARNDRVQVSWTMTDAQFAAFRTWFDDDAEAAGGSAWFYITLAVGQTGTDSVEARFTGPYQASLLGGLNWSVSATLEVR